MGIFDIFSNSDAQNAAAAQTAAYTAGYNQLSDLFGQGRGQLSNTAGAASGDITNYGGAANSAINTNYAAALQTLLQQQGTNNQGQTQLSNLLGLNGPNGSATAQNTLENLPGYQFALNQGTQNVERQQAATGQLDSGATDKAIADYTTGVASQNYNNYVAQLQPYLNASNAGAGAIAGTQTGQGNALSANLTGQGGALAGIQTGLGQGLNQSFTTQGNAAYGTQAAIGNAQAQADYANLAQSAGIFGTLGGIAQSALKLSDERAKDDIEKVGELFDGTNVYRYRYKGDRHHEIGLIAQEVERDRPDAVGRIGDFKAVDYAKATDWAAELGRMMEAA
jgi:hypothetical protein